MHNQDFNEQVRNLIQELQDLDELHRQAVFWTTTALEEGAPLTHTTPEWIAATPS